MTNFNNMLILTTTTFKDYKILLKDTSIKSCKCYEAYWKNVINSKIPVIHFDALIEKELTYRKYYVKGKSIHHICKNCLNQAICSIPSTIIEFETTMKRRLTCISELRNNSILIGDCCDGCINFVIFNFSSSVLINI